MSLSRRTFLARSAASMTMASCALGTTALALEQTTQLSNDKGKVFRDYETAPEHVIRFYKEHHEKQTYALAKAKRQYYGKLNQGQFSAWEMMLRLNEIQDNSDPDISLSQMEHAFQVAESMKNEGLPEWMMVAGFIHDAGKALILWGEPQWAVVGDTFPTGLRYSEGIVQYDFLNRNPDIETAEYRSDFGVYKPGIGLDKVIMTWGHDEYLYQVLKNQSSLPEEALFAIRFHSLYPLHTAKDQRYIALMDDSDRKNLIWAQKLNQYDLYSKSDTMYSQDVSLVAEYKTLVERYIPGTIRW